MLDEAALLTSFRDPAGSVTVEAARVYRTVSAEVQPGFEQFLATSYAQDLVASRRLVSSRLSGLLPAGAAVYEHERIPFISYPYEWPPEMLWAAAELTAGLALAALEHGYGLKDATPYNVLFRGPRPVFVDVLSFERRDANDPTWLAYAQFVRTFLLPLLANKRFGLGLDQLLLTRRDGLEAEELVRLLPATARWRPPFLQLVTLPARLGRKRGAGDPEMYRPTRLDNPEKAAFILRTLMRGLHKHLEAARPRRVESRWSGYMEHNSYSDSGFQDKEAFVRGFLERRRPARVLDAGCNTGHFSEMAARTGARVVALDSDPVVAGETWRRAVAKDLNILPLAVNLARPTPGMGWRNRECASFLERACGEFDAVLLLAVVHHLLVSERVPLNEIADLSASLTREWAVVEYVGPGDPMFQRLARGRDALHAGLTPAAFEAAFLRRFEMADETPESGSGRRLYLFRKRAA
jgi:SAM-dependent methyltransferase